MTSPVPLRLPTWRHHLTAESAPRLPFGLPEMLDEGKRILLIGRASGQNGKKSRQYAVNDLFECADQLAQQAGIDARSLLPTKDSMMQLLADARPEISRDDEGRKFSNRYVVVDRTSTSQIAFLVSCGSGSKLNEEGNQPFIRYAGSLVRRLDVGLFYCKRLDRAGREDFGLAPLATPLRDCFFGDDSGIVEINSGSSVMLFVRGNSGRQTAQDMPRQTRRTQLSMTGDKMVGGRVPYHLGMPPPPGFGLAWLKGGAVKPEKRILFLDCDRGRPADEEVAYGLSEVRDEQGRRVDQVENVRFVLSKVGRPGWPRDRILDELSRRNFSTQHMRAIGRLDTIVGRSGEGGSYASVIANLDVYETGVLRRKVGSGLDDVVISDCFPLDGRWGEPEDFKRIRDYMGRGRGQYARSRYLALSGLRGTFDGTPMRLRLTRGRNETVPRYSFFGPDDHTVESSFPVPALAIGESVRDGIARAGEVGIKLATAYDLVDAYDDGTSTLAADESEITAQLKSLVERKEVIFDRLGETSHDGTPILRGALLQDVQDQYNEISEKQIPELEERRAALQEEIESVRKSRPGGVVAEQLLHLIGSLSDPYDRSYRSVWLSSIRGLRFTTSRFRRRGVKGRRVSWVGYLELLEDGTSYAIPFEGEYEAGSAATIEERLPAAAEQLVADLRAGIPMADSEALYKRQTARMVPDLLSVDRSRFLLDEVSDPRITRTVVAVYEKGGRSVEDVAGALGEPVGFVERVADIHVEGLGDLKHWRITYGRAESGLYLDAIANGGRTSAPAVVAREGVDRNHVYNVMLHLHAEGAPWETLRKKGYELLACECGSRRRLPATIPEPMGPICVDCRTDMGGLVWPSDAYDRYLIDRING